jgi:hypothetical protein
MVQTIDHSLDDSYLILCFYNKALASSSMRAVQTSNELKKKYRYVCNNPDFNKFIKNNKKYKLTNKKTVVFLFKYANIPEKFNNILKNPFIIWDTIDGLDKRSSLLNNEIVYKTCHLINCCNSGMMKILQKYNSLNKIIDCIPHNWDTRMRKYWNNAIENENLENPVFVFLGTSQQHFDKKYKNFNGNRQIAKELVHNKNNLIGKFNVCSSFRTKSVAMPKPGTKCAVAASINCLFLANKNEYGVHDLLGDDYPYYFDDNINDETIKKTMNYMKETYKKEPWNKAKECMKIAKEKSDVINTTKLFIAHIENHYEK